MVQLHGYIFHHLLTACNTRVSPTSGLRTRRLGCLASGGKEPDSFSPLSPEGTLRGRITLTVKSVSFAFTVTGSALAPAGNPESTTPTSAFSPWRRSILPWILTMVSFFG